MKKQLLIAIFLISSATAEAQTNELMGQYYLNMPAYNPAHTGSDNFLNITGGFRQQWTGFAGSPRSTFISAYGVPGSKNADSLSMTRARHGAGAYAISNQQGPFRQTEISLMYAYHVPVARKTFISLGISPSVARDEIDIPSISVEDPVSDVVYQSLISQGNTFSKLMINSGLALYSDRFFMSYSFRELSRISLGGNEDAFRQSGDRRHHLMAGYTQRLSQQLELMPNAFLRLASSRPNLIELGSRIRHNRNSWLGLSWRNDNSVVASLGFITRGRFQFGYAFEHKAFGIGQLATTSHEFTIGLHLLKPRKKAPALRIVAPLPPPALEEVTVEEILIPEPVLITPAVLASTGEPLSRVSMIVKNLQDSSSNTYELMPGLQIPFLPGADYEVFASAEGYQPASAVFDAAMIDHMTNDPNFTIRLKKTGPFSRFSVGESIDLNVKYSLGKSQVSEESQEQLDKLVSLLEENPTLRLEIGAHTDARGTNQANLALSKRRAQSAVDYLISKGVSRERLVARGYGETKLKITDAKSEQEHETNRRTSIVITGI